MERECLSCICSQARRRVFIPLHQICPLGLFPCIPVVPAEASPILVNAAAGAWQTKKQPGGTTAPRPVVPDICHPNISTAPENIEYFLWNPRKYRPGAVHDGRYYRATPGSTGLRENPRNCSTMKTAITFSSGLRFR